MDTLTDKDRGMYAVYTESSMYQIDLTDYGHGLRRRPITSDASTLRQDDEPLTLLRIAECKVGERARFYLRLDHNTPEGYLATMRDTTIVQRIEED